MILFIFSERNIFINVEWPSVSNSDKVLDLEIILPRARTGYHLL